ncbi:Hypothetical_protein [Hexamita inflata]|uniref:Hypothetical_protein n=1 Tax=Hexamita inflata TaxID=28002 RepID=A0ABP1HV15_9EUKA
MQIIQLVANILTNQDGAKTDQILVNHKFTFGYQRTDAARKQADSKYFCATQQVPGNSVPFGLQTSGQLSASGDVSIQTTPFLAKHTQHNPRRHANESRFAAQAPRLNAQRARNMLDQLRQSLPPQCAVDHQSESKDEFNGRYFMRQCVQSCLYGIGIFFISCSQASADVAQTSTPRRKRQSRSGALFHQLLFIFLNATASLEK